MFEPAFADVAEKLLQLRNMHDAGAAKGFERIVGKISFADVAANFSFTIVGRDADKTHRTGLDSAHAGAKGVFLADSTGDDLLKVHAHILEKMLGKIAAMETNGLVGIVRVIVIPVEQRAGSFGSQPQGVHANHAGNIDFAGAGHAFVAHHTHHGAGDDTKIFFQRSPALNGADDHVGVLHPAVDHRAELGHLEEGSVWNALRGNIFADGLEFFLRGGVVVFHTRDAPENLGKVNSFDGDSVGFEDLLTVADGVERCGPRADCADA